MKMKAQRVLRARRTHAPRHLRPRATDRARPQRSEDERPWPEGVPVGRRRPALATDATTEPEPGPGPEAVFDRVTGPYGARRAYDEET
jgi:hypothetical protein